jgi:hypothetical protein
MKRVLAWALLGAFFKAPPGVSHCGCVNKDSCVEPCNSCCGPAGYADCFAPPSPTAVGSSSCCGGGR